MKFKSVLLGCVFGAGLAVSDAAASPITYDINIVAATSSVTGTITTDGTLGILQTADVTSWNLNLTNQYGSATTSTGSVVVVGTDLSATASALSFDFTDNSSFSFFDITFGQSFLAMAVQPPNGPNGLSVHLPLVSLTGGNWELPSSNVIGTVATTPLPSGFPMFLTGAGLIFGFANRKKLLGKFAPMVTA